MGYNVLHGGHSMDKGTVTGKSFGWERSGLSEKSRAGVPYLAIRSVSHHSSLNLSFSICFIGIVIILFIGLNEIKK